MLCQRIIFTYELKCVSTYHIYSDYFGCVFLTGIAIDCRRLKAFECWSLSPFKYIKSNLFSTDSDSFGHFHVSQRLWQLVHNIVCVCRFFVVAICYVLLNVVWSVMIIIIANSKSVSHLKEMVNRSH